MSTALGHAVSRTDGENSVKDWVAWLMQHPYGTGAVMALGVGIAAAGLVMIWQAWKGDRIVEFLDCPHEQRWWIVLAGRLGFAAKGIVFGLIGSFLAFAGYIGRSREARGLDGALENLAQPNGWMLLAAIAAGLMAFGLFGIVQTFYRRIRPPKFDPALNKAAQVSTSAIHPG